jgi:hypothetical protein
MKWVHAYQRRAVCLPLILLALTVADLRAQSFVPAGNMTRPRVGHSATLLQDGRVLMAGGSNPTGFYGNLPARATSSAEVYDPLSGTFAETGPMTVSRSGHVAVLLRDGQVLLVGGCGSNCVRAELYNPVTGTFARTGDSSVTFPSASAVRLKNGTVLVSGIGGSTVFDPATGAFVPLNGGQGIGGTATLLAGGTVLLTSPLSVWLYDPASDRIRKLPISRGPIEGAQGTQLLDGSVLFTGGYSDDYGDTAIAQSVVYYRDTEAFKVKADLALARDSHTSTLLKDGRVLVAGGYNGDGADAVTGIFSSAELYDPGTGTFSHLPSMVRNRDGHEATLLNDGRILLTGGRISTQRWPPDPNDTTAEIFVPASTQDAVPRIALDWTRFCAGDSWVLRAEMTGPLASVQISGISDGTPWTTPDWNTSGQDGTLVATGTFGDDAVGDHTVWIHAGGKVSNSVPVRIETCPAKLVIGLTRFPQPFVTSRSFYMGDSWTLRATGSKPGADVTLLGISNGVSWTIEGWARTGSGGSFEVSGRFQPGSEGYHALRIIVGSTQSNLVRFDVFDY